MAKSGLTALVVGDVKQSIMGFQSVDPRLMRSMMGHHHQCCQPLDSNWRSQAPLMDIVNAIGTEMFGENYTRLAPKAPFKSKLNPLEVISFEGKGIKQRVQAQHVAARIKDILTDNQTQVYDSSLKCHRRVRGEDIAILGLTHIRLKEYADVLNDVGIRSRLEQDGWFLSRPVQLLYHGLCLMADPNDRHAVLHLAVTELGHDDLNSATEALLNDEKLNLPFLDQLAAVAKHSEALTVDELVTQTIEAMGLYEIVSNWPDATQARANLLRFQAEANAFVQADWEALSGGGFYGSGLKTFMAWLRRIIQEKDGDRQPTPHVHDEDAIQLFTWHAAKGREWPIVVVTTLDRDAKGRLPSLDIEYTSFKDLGAVLENAWIEFSPEFAATETKENFQRSLDEKAQEEGLNLLYVALTRQREQLILEWNQNLATSKRFTFWHLLKDSANMRLEANRMHVGDTSFTCRVTAADRELPIEFQSPKIATSPALPAIGRRVLRPTAAPIILIPEFIVPSGLHDLEGKQRPSKISTIRYAKPLKMLLPSGAERGIIVHRALELLCQDVTEKNARIAIGVPISEADWKVLQSTAKCFLQTLYERFSPVAIHWEVPIVASENSGSVISGTIDLLLDTGSGYWIIDHKSDETEDREERFARYLPQLDCYKRAVSEGMGLYVAGVAIHWVGYGEISCQPFIE